MDDLISRAWLLDVVENLIPWDTEKDRNRAIHHVRELASPVLPPIKEKCCYCPHCENCDVEEEITRKIIAEANKACSECQEGDCYGCVYSEWRNKHE